MAVARPIAEFDIVELTETVNDAPAGHPRRVLGLHPVNKAMVGITEPPLDGAARIVFVPLANLKGIDAG